MAYPIDSPNYGFDDYRIVRAVEIAAMRNPVRCLRCHNGLYDLGMVEVTARYTDCSVWKTPCCGHTVDDRGQVSSFFRKDYEVLRRGGAS